MNISEEKEHLYSMMREITEERRRLTEIYFSLKQRLDSLNTLEVRGLEDLSIKGYVDLFNNRDRKQVTTNLEREMNAVKEKAEKEEEKIDYKIPKKEIEIERDKRPKRSAYLNLDKVMGTISYVLKNSDVPMSLKDLHSNVQKESDMEIKINNFRNNILPRAIQKNKNIQRATRGYYQYVR